MCSSVCKTCYAAFCLNSAGKRASWVGTPGWQALCVWNASQDAAGWQENSGVAMGLWVNNTQYLITQDAESGRNERVRKSVA